MSEVDTVAAPEPTLSLVFFGHPMLDVVTDKVDVVAFNGLAEARKLGEEMIALCRRHDEALGLAAPQVGENLRLFVMKQNDGDFIICANPQIVLTHSEATPFLEGCLSLPGFQATISRPYHITVEYVDVISGFQVQRSLVGLEARVFQHELDHLNGVLIADKASRNDWRRGLSALKAAAQFTEKRFGNTAGREYPRRRVKEQRKLSQ